MLKVFFTASVREYQKNKPIYLEITNILQRLNCELTWHLIDTVEQRLKNGQHELTQSEWKKVYKDMENALVSADIAILENTTSAFSTGFLAGIAISKAIPTLVIKSTNTVHTFKTSFIYGIDSPYFQVETYRNINDLYHIIKNFIEAYSENNKTSSFHLKLSAPERRFIDQMAKKLGMTRIQFIRKLIKDQMIKH